jgi:heptaprenyl diphosphate synthase
MVLSFLESLIPAFVAVPGIKVGLPNIVIVFLLYSLGWQYAAAVSLVRVVLVSILFGNVQIMLFSLAGAALSLICMALLKRTKLFSCVAVSVVGGVLHNVGQIAVAILWTQTPQVVFYLPMLLITGTVAGVVIGLAAGVIVKRLENIKF